MNYRRQPLYTLLLLTYRDLSGGVRYRVVDEVVYRTMAQKTPLATLLGEYAMCVIVTLFYRPPAAAAEAVVVMVGARIPCTLSQLVCCLTFWDSPPRASGVHCSGLPLPVTNEHNTPLTGRRLGRSDSPRRLGYAGPGGAGRG
ncbi:hypothetical protein E2C01_018856 [Portunus trituberculatus]|uniref:Uncharacterized protein n=1 Tax=Portunus trituberculatus TaxID=210409 RepID=A0A5B7DY80_PORTR|nr:hypothetical protein [Portunus trituberculatus]